ncbi:MAG: 30S ribosome-binding factor RbfA [Bacteroidales bacterium]
MESKRQQKVAKQIQRDLGEIFQEEARLYFRNALITVTKVNISRDLSVAKINLSLFSTEDKQELLDEIKERAKEIRHKLAARVKHQLRIVPQLLFYEDDSLDYIDNIENLLKE